MTGRDVLRRTKEVLLDRGWQQGGFVDDDGRVCLLGAMNIVAGRQPNKAAEGPGFELALEALWDVAELEIGRWNDQPGRTFAEVVATIDLAIAKLPADKPLALA